MNRFLDKVKQGASKASEKAQLVVELNRIQSQIDSRRKEWEQHAYEIGCMAFDAYKDQKMDTLREQMSELASANIRLEEEIEALEWKRCELRHEKRCDECGEISAWTSNFCANCGAKLPDAPASIRQTDFSTTKSEVKRKPSHDGYITLNPVQQSNVMKPSELKLNVQDSYADHEEHAASSEVYEQQAALSEEDMYFPPRAARTSSYQAEDSREEARYASSSIPHDQKPCAGCGSLAPLDAKWCERCGAPFI
ncbi:hypothetical protein [Paenibacillus aquistagni]|uniref:hypothetical protein n=1 Tax=Paenibacillus aquistagni TaxID=1852522 RepID=UPI00145ADBD2|nr:hypothetical protein [Paenibacillus aquistagni]NMM53147.1 hypothetical protein [Paenibacillus aquistagni]